MTAAEREAELIRLRTLTGNFYHRPEQRGCRWWEDPEYLDLLQRIEAAKQVNELTDFTPSKE